MSKKTVEGESVAQVVRRVRLLLGDLTLIERLETFGLLALIEAVEHGFTDQQVTMMYEVMRDRFASSAPRYRAATQTAQLLHKVRPEYIMRLLESRP